MTAIASLESLESVKADHPILVVDDDMAVRRLFSISLKRAGFLVEEATDGQDAIERIAKEQFSAVLMDNHMPRMSGLEAITHLRSQEETATLPIILVTGAAEVAE